MTASARCTSFSSRLMRRASRRCAGFFLADAMRCAWSRNALAARVLLDGSASRTAFVFDLVLLAGADEGTGVASTLRCLRLWGRGVLGGGVRGVLPPVDVGVACTLGSGGVLGLLSLVMDRVIRCTSGGGVLSTLGAAGRTLGSACIVMSSCSFSGSDVMRCMSRMSCVASMPLIPLIAVAQSDRARIILS